MNENKTPCESCKETPAQVPFYAFESVQCRAEREITRCRILCGVLSAALVLTNGAWLLHFFGVI